MSGALSHRTTRDPSVAVRGERFLPLQSFAPTGVFPKPVAETNLPEPDRATFVAGRARIERAAPDAREADDARPERHEHHERADARTWAHEHLGPVCDGLHLGPELARGGMARVHEAYARDGRDAVVKVLERSAINTRRVHALFERSAQIMAQLAHPGVARVLGFERDGSARFVAGFAAEGRAIGRCGCVGR